MINEKIIEYVKQNLELGYNVDTIKNRLIDEGYPQSDIEDTIAHVQQQFKVEQKKVDESKTKFASFRTKFSLGLMIVILVLVAVTAGLTYFFVSYKYNNLAASKNTDGQMLSGSSVAESIYEEGNLSAKEFEVDEAIISEDNGTFSESKEDVEKTNEQYTEITANDTQITINETQDSTQAIAQSEDKIEEFKFSPTSIVNTQHNISLSLDDLKHEIKSEYWGKITEITMTVLNKGDNTFKPKVLVLLYDEKDFKEEWLKPKAEIQFENQLNVGEHTTRQAIVNIAFDDINLTKNFKLILVNADDPGNKPIVVVENEFKPT